MHVNSLYSREVANAIIAEYMAGGCSLSEACNHAGVDLARFKFWLEDTDTDPELPTIWGRAMRVRAWAMAEEVLKIADDTCEDFQIIEGKPRLVAEHVTRSKLRVETRFRLMKFMNPALFGDKGGEGSGASIQINIGKEDADALGLAPDDAV